MIITIEINDKNYQVEQTDPLDISIPLEFGGAQPNAYGAEKATAEPCAAGEIIGDTRRGGSCNFEQYKFIPHCNGTHTESVGHITNERISIHDSLRDAFIPAVLISVEPENVLETSETYPAKMRETDRVITGKALENALRKLENQNVNIENPGGLIIRTLPNDENKLTRSYLEDIPPFLTTEAIKFIVSKNIGHLLIDVPSIDRIFDEGKLSNHRIFWNVEPGKFELNEKSLRNNTVTEMIFAPNAVKDGFYLLNLQIAAFVADAAPSRPILFKMVE